MIKIDSGEPTLDGSGVDRDATCPASRAGRSVTAKQVRTRSGGKIRTLLLRSVIILGIAITPVWIGLLLWLAYRAGSWLVN